MSKKRRLELSFLYCVEENAQGITWGMVAAGEERDRPRKSSRTMDNPDLKLYKNQFFIMHIEDYDQYPKHCELGDSTVLCSSPRYYQN